MQLLIGNRTYANSEAIVRWTYRTQEICEALTLKDVFDIVATIWLSDGSNAVITTIDELVELKDWVNNQQSLGANPEKGTFEYYVSQRFRFERLVK